VTHLRCQTRPVLLSCLTTCHLTLNNFLQRFVNFVDFVVSDFYGIVSHYLIIFVYDISTLCFLWTELEIMSFRRQTQIHSRNYVLFRGIWTVDIYR